MKLDRALVTNAMAANMEAVFWSGMPSNLACWLSVGEPAADDDDVVAFNTRLASSASAAAAAAADSVASDNRNRLLLLLLLWFEEMDDLRLELHSDKSVGDGEADRTRLTLADSIIVLTCQ